jgi:hypothetical protein
MIEMFRLLNKVVGIACFCWFACVLAGRVVAPFQYSLGLVVAGILLVVSANLPRTKVVLDAVLVLVSAVAFYVFCQPDVTRLLAELSEGDWSGLLLRLNTASHPGERSFWDWTSRTIFEFLVPLYFVPSLLVVFWRLASGWKNRNARAKGLAQG